MSKKQQEQDSDKQEKEKKEKKVKVIYYDDGSTIADMSGTHGKYRGPRQKSTFREKMKTYFAVVKRMILPMLCVLASFLLVYIFLLAITGNLW